MCRFRVTLIDFSLVHSWVILGEEDRNTPIGLENGGPNRGVYPLIYSISLPLLPVPFVIVFLLHCDTKQARRKDPHSKDEAV